MALKEPSAVFPLSLPSSTLLILGGGKEEVVKEERGQIVWFAFSYAIYELGR